METVKIKLLKSTVASGKRLILKKDGENIHEVSVSDARYLLATNKAVKLAEAKAPTKAKK